MLNRMRGDTAFFAFCSRRASISCGERCGSKEGGAPCKSSERWINTQEEPMEAAQHANTAAAALHSLRKGPVQSQQQKQQQELDSLLQQPSPNSYEQAGEVLPVDLLAQCFVHLSSFRDMAVVNQVCKAWRRAMKLSLAYRKKLSFAGSRIDDSSVASLVTEAVSLLDLDMSAGRWGCRITNLALYAIARSKCCPYLRSVSLWGVTAITDEGVLQLVLEARSLENLNVGGTFITDVSLVAISAHCKLLRVLNLWGCKHVTFEGLLHLASGCSRLHALNVWGMKLSHAAMQSLQALNPRLQIKPSKEFLQIL